MNVCVFGLGYVGCVNAACLARDGHTVIGIDVNPQKVEQIEAGQSPIVEPGLNALVATGARSGRLRATENAFAAVLASDVSLVCVGSPSRDNSSLDLQYVEKACGEIGAALAVKDGYHVVVVRSTVLPDPVQERLVPILEQQSGRCAGVDFGVCMNPEFLREGSALDDSDHPSYIIIGELDQRSGDIVEWLYANINAPVVRTSIKVAEMLKYASNAFHALKISFANEIGDLCKAQGIDGQEVMDIFVQDRRLNSSSAYLRPGFAFGGSCLPKDLRALLYRAKLHDLDLPVLDAVLESNQKQIQRGIEMVERIGRKRVGVLGLSFKAGTDDVRESPVVSLVETLIGRGYRVTIHDDIVDSNHLVGANRAFLERELPHIASIMRCSVEEVVEEAEVLVIGNSSPTYRQVPRMMRMEQTLIDLVGTARHCNGIEGAYEGIAW